MRVGLAKGAVGAFAALFVISPLAFAHEPHEGISIDEAKNTELQVLSGGPRFGLTHPLSFSGGVGVNVHLHGALNLAAWGEAGVGEKDNRGRGVGAIGELALGWPLEVPARYRRPTTEWGRHSLPHPRAFVFEVGARTESPLVWFYTADDSISPSRTRRQQALYPLAGIRYVARWQEVSDDHVNALWIHAIGPIWGLPRAQSGETGYLGSFGGRGDPKSGVELSKTSSVGIKLGGSVVIWPDWLWSTWHPATNFEVIYLPGGSWETAFGVTFPLL